MEDGSTLEFNQCTKLHMKDKLEAKKDITINPSGLSIIFYVDDDVYFDEGAHVTGVFYLGNANTNDTVKHHLHIANSKTENPAVFTGMFLAECIHSGKNTSFYMNPACNFCTKSAYAQDDPINPVDGSLIMLKNYPNPFSDKTTIAFMLAEDTHVRLDVFDVSGKLVQTIYNEDVKMNQEYKAEFNGTMHRPGMYICKMTTNDEVFIHKLMLMK
jgi:hypothetical protein